MINRRITVIAILSGLLPCFATAQETPKATLEKTLRQLETTRYEERQIAGKVERIAHELGEIKTQSDRAVATIRQLNDDIAMQERELDALEQKKAVRQKTLDAKRSEIARLLHGIIRMQQLPRQFVIAKPGNPDELLRTASALHITYQATDEQMASIERDFAELESLKEALIATRSTLEANRSKLTRQHATLRQTLSERQSLQQSLQRDHSAIRARVNILSAESSSLQELMDKLANEQSLFADLGTPIPKPKAPTRTNQRPANTAQTASAPVGRMEYPSPGQLIHRFGDKQGANERYRGLVLRTASGAPVTAPQTGKIVFSGTFMDYGNMVIIQHDDGVHSVIAGMDVLKVEPGQNLAAGDTVGVMGNTADATELYFELRKNSKSIDPVAWMGNLSSVASR